jgi:hypothetical protein
MQYVHLLRHLQQSGGLSQDEQRKAAKLKGIIQAYTHKVSDGRRQSAAPVCCKRQWLMSSTVLLRSRWCRLMLLLMQCAGTL